MEKKLTVDLTYLIRMNNSALRTYFSKFIAGYSVDLAMIITGDHVHFAEFMTKEIFQYTPPGYVPTPIYSDPVSQHVIWKGRALGHPYHYNDPIDDLSFNTFKMQLKEKVKEYLESQGYSVTEDKE